MTLTAFLTYIKYSGDCPARIDPIRWRAMLRWVELNCYDDASD